MGDNVIKDDVETLEHVCNSLEKELLTTDEEVRRLKNLIHEMKKPIEELMQLNLKNEAYEREHPEEVV